MTRPGDGELSDWSLESDTAERLRALLRRRRAGPVWFSEHSPSRLVLLAVLVGIAGGFGAVLFRDLIGLVHNLAFLGKWSLSYDANLHTSESPWGAWIIGMPVIGALVVAFIVKNFAPEAKGHGVPEVVDAIYYRGGIIRPVVTLIKALASGISIGTGGSVGREGPIIQIACAFGSTVARLTRLPEWQRITLVACGGAAGIAATFNTPIGGLLFAIEIILPEISARTVIPVALAAGAATFVGRAFFGDYPAFDIPALALPASYHLSLGPIAAYVALGALFGVMSVVFIRSIYASEDRFEKLPGGYYGQHVLGMALVGVLFYLCQRYLGHYYVAGIGYATVQDTLTHALTDPYVLLLLCFLKLLATSLTLGSGGSGGIFSPSLFMGATFGAGFALLGNALVPGLQLDVAGTAVIGMAAVVGAATGAVVTAIVMIFEMTRDYNVIVPLMITVSVAYGVRRLLMTDSIYTMKLTRRGHVIPDAFHTNLYMLRTVADFIHTPMQIADADLPVSTLFDGLARQTFVPHVLVTHEGKVYGVLSSRRILNMLRRGNRSGTVGEHARTGYAVVHSRDLIFDVLARLREKGGDIALLTREGELESPDDVTGIVTWSDILLHGNIPLPLRRRRRPEAQSAG
ncbi:MAG TPA: chloride channel protein [Burkholderiales bacterium]|nr:chloride channel protein [Burkholderiales bacterium]